MNKTGKEPSRAGAEAGADEYLRGQDAITALDRRIGRAVLFVAMVVLGYKLIGASFYGVYAWLFRGEELMFWEIIFAYAWSAYLLMGVFWVVDRRIWKVIPLTGTMAGTVGVVFSAFMIVPFLLVLPHVIFAYHLARFHLYE